MADFTFLHNPKSHIWVIAAPRRAKRPNEADKHLTSCPFCPGGAADKQEVYRISKSEAKYRTVPGEAPASPNRGERNPKSETNSNDQNAKHTNVSSFENSGLDIVSNFDIRNSNLNRNSEWLVRVVYNTFPFAPIHEVVIHGEDHLKSFAQLPVEHVDAIFQAFQHRYNEHAHRGQVIIFHNHGVTAGESLPHPHTQLAVIPEKVRIDAPILSSILPFEKEFAMETESFFLITPKISQWPDEVWLAPKTKGKTFGQLLDQERRELAYLVKQLILIFDHRNNRDFPFNFYIYPGEHWYLRIIPRIKSIGGFELATGIYVNTQNPKETMAFIREHLHEPDLEKILKEHQAEYHRSV